MYLRSTATGWFCTTNDSALTTVVNVKRQILNGIQEIYWFRLDLAAGSWVDWTVKRPGPDSCGFLFTENSPQISNA